MFTCRHVGLSSADPEGAGAVSVFHTMSRILARSASVRGKSSPWISRATSARKLLMTIECGSGLAVLTSLWAFTREEDSPNSRHSSATSAL
jgi:hypothetical protein